MCVKVSVRVGVHLVAYSHLNSSVAAELRWPVCTTEPAWYSACKPGLIHYALALLYSFLPPHPTPSLLERTNFPQRCSKCELNERFHLSCGYWHAITKGLHLSSCGNVIQYKRGTVCIWVTPSGIHGEYSRECSAHGGANYNWTIPWKREFASHLVNWGLIIFTL